MTSTETREATMRASAEHWQRLEAIAACLREEGLKAVTQRTITLFPSKIGIVREKEWNGLWGSKFKTYENTHTIFLTDGDLAVVLGNEVTGTTEPLALIPLADPQCFRKVKEVIRKNP